ncbi:MAG: hypothetical protein V7727_19915 [Sneathiella sp.]
MPEETLQPKRRLRFRWWILPIILVAGISGGSWAWDYYKLYSGQTPMFDVAIKLKVGDEIVEIDRTVPCIKEYYGEILPYFVRPWEWYKRPFNYSPRDLSTGLELNDGQGVIVSIPLVCELIQEAKSKDSGGNVLDKDFLPTVALLDDADDPQVIKKIVSRSYYRRSDRDVEVLEYKIKPARAGSLPSLRDKFNWLRGRTFVGSPFGYDGKDLYYRQSYLIGLPLELFRSGNPEEVPIEGVSDLVSLYDLPGFTYPEALKEKYNDGIAFPKIGPVNSGKASQFGIGSESTPYAKYISFDHVYPIFSNPDGWTFDARQQGYLMLYRQKMGKLPGATKVLNKDENGNLVSRTNLIEFNIVKNGTNILVANEVIWPIGGRSIGVRAPFFYDPDTEFVYWLHTYVVRYPDFR